VSLVLHVCCAPCAVNPLKLFGEKGEKILSFYFNPNIHPYQEYQKRRESFWRLSQEFGLESEEGDYRPEVYFQLIGEKTERPERCRLCYSLRLKETARLAKERGFLKISTTILVSPYQEHEIARQEGEKVAREFGLEFVYYDLRSCYYQGLNEARGKGYYSQWYCGCLFSEMERVKEKEVKRGAGI